MRRPATLSGSNGTTNRAYYAGGDPSSARFREASTAGYTMLPRAMFMSSPRYYFDLPTSNNSGSAKASAMGTPTPQPSGITYGTGPSMLRAVQSMFTSSRSSLRHDCQAWDVPEITYIKLSMMGSRLVPRCLPGRWQNHLQVLRRRLRRLIVSPLKES